METSSFTYRQWVGGNTLMVIIPHEDDEMNMAGATIYGAKQEGLRVLLVFMTNGDYEYEHTVRFSDTYRMAQHMGVPTEDIIFLGFPDHVMHDISDLHHVYVNDQGQSTTHGDGHTLDFARRIHEEPYPYSYASLVKAIEDCILWYRPHMIIGTDYDTHRDHRLCALATDLAIHNVLRTHTTYAPNVLKGFAYATGYETIDDFHNNHLQSTVINRQAITPVGYSTGNPTLPWRRRMRIPVPQDCMDMNLVDNPIFKGMAAHSSQEAYKRGSRLINGDQVFWHRPRNLIGIEATIHVSSGHGAFLNDGIYFYQERLDTNDIDVSTFLWMPTDEKPTITYTFREPQTIAHITLYTSDYMRTSIETSKQAPLASANEVWQNASIQELCITVNGDSQTYALNKGLLYDEGIMHIVLTEPLQTQNICIQITKHTDAFLGLSEIELQSTLPQDTYCHILGDNQFMYDWVVFPGEKVPKITLYTDSCILYDTPREGYRWCINNRQVPYESLQDDVEEALQKGPLLLRVEHSTKCIWCEATLRNGTLREWIRKHWSNMVNRYRYIRAKGQYKRLYKEAQAYRHH